MKNTKTNSKVLGQYRPDSAIGQIALKLMKAPTTEKNLVSIAKKAGNKNPDQLIWRLNRNGRKAKQWAVVQKGNLLQLVTGKRAKALARSKAA